jgi:Trypsin/PEP-CTERM motif
MHKRSCFSHSVIAPLAVGAALCFAPAAHAIVNGTATNSFGAIGELAGASGVLIASNWVLTAAHVASSLTAGSSSFVSQGGTSLVSAIYTYSSAGFPSDDIALVQLSASLNIATPILNDEVITSSQVESLGTLTMVSAQNQAPNGFAYATAYDVTPTYQDDDGGPVAVNWLLTNGNAHLQGGDSGGALFAGATTNSAGELLLGVASAVLQNGETGATEGSAFVQVASYRSWIDATMASSGQQATWVSSVPEPSSLLLLAAGGMAILARRTGQTSRNG